MKCKDYSLFELADWKNGLAFKKIDFSETGKPIIKIAELKNGITSQTQFTQGNYGRAVYLTKGDMVFSWSGNPETSIDVFWYDLTDGWLNQHIFKVTPKCFVDKKYLYFLLKSLKSKFTAIASNKQTTGLGHVTVKDLKEMTISLPDMTTQKAIGNYLAIIDQKVYLNKEINDNLERQALELFSNYQKASDKKICFTDVIQILGGGTPRTKESAYWDGDIPFFTPKDVGCPYMISTEKTITEDGLNRCNSRLYPVNTVFVTARGTVGKVCMPGVPMAMNQSCYALVGKNLHQLMVYFYTLATVERLKHKASGAVFDAITTRDFSSEYINRLSEQDEKSFLKIVEPMFQMMLSNIFENKKLENLRDTLLPKLMAGELAV